jgi:hypothetical protein
MAEQPELAVCALPRAPPSNDKIRTSWLRSFTNLIPNQRALQSGVQLQPGPKLKGNPKKIDGALLRANSLD